MEKKLLYTFTIDKPEMVDETVVTTDASGQEVKTITKVKKDVPFTYHLYRPTRTQIEDADLFYGVKLAEGIERGLLPKRLLAKRYEEAGGYVAKQEQAKREEMYKNFEDLNNKILKLTEKPDSEKSEEEKAEAEALTKEFWALYERIKDIEAEINDLFQHTAEVWAKNKTMIWWALHLAAKDDDKKNVVDFFEGKTYDEKMAANDKLSDNADEFTLKLVRRFMFLVAFWYNGRASSKESFDKVLEFFEEQERAD